MKEGGQGEMERGKEHGLRSRGRGDRAGPGGLGRLKWGAGAGDSEGRVGEIAKPVQSSD